MRLTKTTAGKTPQDILDGNGFLAPMTEGKGTVEMPVPAGCRKKDEQPEQEKAEVERMVRNTGDEKEGAEACGRTRSNPIVYEAMDHLRTFGYEPVPLRAPGIPLNIVAMKKSGSFFVLAVRSRLPVPSAATLRELFRSRVDRLRAMVERVRERIMIWVYSPSCGWRYYLVYPGGLRYDHNFPSSVE